MKTAHRPSHRHTVLEALEPRHLLAAATVYDFAQLTGYTPSGGTWTYNTAYTVSSNIVGDTSGSITNTVSVQSQAASGGVSLVSVRTTDYAGNPSSVTYKENGTAVHVTKLVSHTGQAATKYKLSGTKLAPESMTVGTPYSGHGTFTGTISGSLDGIAISATLQGTYTTSAELLSVKTLTVPAGTYTTAVKGTESIQLNATMSLTADGQTQPGTLSANYGATLFGVTGVGIVKNRGTTTWDYSLADGKSGSFTLNTTSTLLSASSPAVVAVAPANVSPGGPGASVMTSLPSDLLGDANDLATLG